MAVIQINNLTITESSALCWLEGFNCSWSLQSVGGNYDNSCTVLVHKEKSVAMAVIQTSLP